MESFINRNQELKKNNGKQNNNICDSNNKKEEKRTGECILIYSGVPKSFLAENSKPEDEWFHFFGELQQMVVRISRNEIICIIGDINANVQERLKWNHRWRLNGSLK